VQLEMRRIGRGVATAFVTLAALAAPRPAAPAELVAFVAGASPGAEWQTGYGGMFTITLFNIVHGDLEGAYQGSERIDTKLLSLHAKAYIGPTFGRIVPYAGLGAGVYYEGLESGHDRGSFGSVFVGAKLKFPMGLVVRAEGQWLQLPTGVRVDMTRRFLVGAGLSF
jgi:hypothetical protein